MYCSKCGKEIDYDALVCCECMQAEQQAALAEAPAEEPILTCGNTRKRGFGVALAAVILSFVSAMCAAAVYLGTVFDAYLKILRDYFGGDVMMTSVGMAVFSVLVVVPGVLAVIFGIRSIKTFKSTPHGHPKPIATLIMGIYAIGESVSALYMFLTSLSLFSMWLS